MNELTYDEYFQQLNDEGLYKMLSNMTEVPSMKEAEKASKVLLDAIIDNCGLSKAKIKKAKYALAEVKVHDSHYLVCMYSINEALIMLRATDLNTKKFYIPNDVWIAATNKETEETALELIFSLSTGETK